MSHPYRDYPPEEWKKPRPFGDWLGAWLNVDGFFQGLAAVGVVFGSIGLLAMLIWGGVSYAGRAAARAEAERDLAYVADMRKIQVGECRDVWMAVKERSQAYCPNMHHRLTANDVWIRCTCQVEKPTP